MFFDNFLIYKKKVSKSKKVLDIKNDFKDFLSINQFCKIIHKIISLKVYGIFNVSLSEKFISEIISLIDKNFLTNVRLIKSNKDSFTLSNKSY